MIYNFKKFVTEELISFGKTQPSDRVSDIFTADLLQLRQFLQKQLPSQDLIAIGSGEQGIAFWWKNPKKLTQQFTDEGFLGTDTSNSEKVIKITSNPEEAGNVMLFIKNFGGKEIPGLATYFWIKEIQLPKNKQWSSIFLPAERNVFLRRALPNKPELLSRIPKLDDTEKKMINWFKSHKFKTDKIWIICLEKLRPLTNKEEKIWQFLSNYDYVLTEHKTQFTDDVIAEFWDWLMGPTWKTDFRGLIQIKEENRKKIRDLFKFLDITRQDLIQWFGFYYLLQNSSQHFDFSLDDIHTGNLGFRGDELVIFDCM